MAAIYTIDETFDFGLFNRSSCAFGVFDGVHLGHTYLLEAAQKTAVEAGGASIALTFNRDPDELFIPESTKKLMSNEDRLELLSQTGVDAVCVLSFTREFAATTPREFLEHTFGGQTPAFLHVGTNFNFGAKAAGHVNDLQAWAEKRGTNVCAHRLVCNDGSPITATRIRTLLSEGAIEKANALLGRPFTLHEVVCSGRHNGREFGFCTANLTLPPERQVAAEGVYAGYVLLGGRRYRGAIAMGKSPTFQSATTATCEVNILDFDRDIYGQDIRVELHHYLRPMKKFDSVEELIATVASDIQTVRDIMPLEC